MVELSINGARDCARFQATIAIFEGSVDGLGIDVAVGQRSHGITETHNWG